MRILQFTTSYPVNESDPTAPFIASIAQALSARGHEVVVIAPRRSSGPSPERALTKVRVIWARYALLRQLAVIGHGRSLSNDLRLRARAYIALPFYFVSALASALSLARNWRPDVVHSHWVLPSGLIGAAVARTIGVPHVIALHGSDIFVANSRRLFGTLAGIPLRQAHNIVACSPYLAEQSVLLGAPRDRVHFLPYGVDTTKFRDPAPETRARPPIVLAVGRLVAKKGFNLLVEHAHRFLAHDATAELWIAGEGDSRRDLQALISEQTADIATRIRLLGEVPWDEMPALMTRARLVAVPSIRDASGNQDGLPNVVLEAMSSGTPVIASDIGAAKEVISSGHDGIIFASGDASALVNAIASLVADPLLAARLGAAASETIRRSYSWDNYARRLEALSETR